MKLELHILLNIGKMKKKVLVLGGTGFIGRNVVEHYAKRKDEFDVYATWFSEENEPQDPVEGVGYICIDLRQENEVQFLMNKFGTGIVIHAAATTTGSKDVIERPYLHVTDNAVMNSWIFREAMLNKTEHIVFLSCTVMYQSRDYPQKESDWSNGDDIYDKYFGVGKMKVFSEDMCDFYSRLGNTKYTAIRHSNVYGPHDKFDLDKCHVVPAFVNKIINSPERLDVWGDGSAKRDILFIDDLVDMIDKVFKNQENKYELYNCGGGRAYSIKELADAIMLVNNKQLTMVYDETKPNIPTVVILNCEKAKDELGWEAKTSIEDGLRKTSEWYKEKYL